MISNCSWAPPGHRVRGVEQQSLSLTPPQAPRLWCGAGAVRAPACGVAQAQCYFPPVAWRRCSAPSHLRLGAGAVRPPACGVDRGCLGTHVKEGLPA